MKNYVLFCGLPRTLDLFKKSLDQIEILKEEGLVEGVFFATWHNEVNNPQLKALAAQYNIVVKGFTPPHDPGFVNINFQMKALDYGLTMVPEDSFVLKHRSDYFINAQIMRKVLQDPERFLQKPPGAGDIFKSKVWTIWAEMTKPFYMEDGVFFGRQEDLKKLVNYNTVYEDQNYFQYLGQGITHIRRFIHPFLGVEVFSDYISGKVQYASGFKNPENFKSIVKEDPSMTRLIGSYYKVLYNYFKIYSEAKCAQFKHLYCNPEISLDNDKYSQNIERSKIFFSGFVNCYDDTIIKNLIEGKFNESDEIAALIYKAAQELSI